MPPASTFGQGVDTVFAVLLVLAGVITLTIVSLIVFFSVRYRRNSKANRDNIPLTNLRLEITWIIIPLIIGMGVFVWAASIFYERTEVPPNTLDIYVIAKQWMWKVQHPDGQREINELHIPVGQPVRLIMISQDVIHSFWVPDFRVKQDVLPGRYTTLWFQTTRTGTMALRCAEYCGTDHSLMTGNVIVMEPAAYQQWLSGNQTSTTLSEDGQQLFEQNGCSNCHHNDGSGDGPSLVGIYDSTVQLQDGSSVTANMDYLRESILNPDARIVAGYTSIMPPFEGRLSEDEVLSLIDYIRSLSNVSE
jgi:cytochrome c oxidase subunit 2